MIVPGLIAAARQGIAAGLTPFTLGANDFAFTGAAVKRVVPAGVKSVRIKMWGGGAGPGQFGNAGGPGGFVFTTIEVNPGDVFLIQTAGGGTRALGAVPRSGGAGGWPDGGDGATSSSSAFSQGGGGGSSRVFVNNILVAVAAGGGGGGSGSGSGQGGVGGGFYGFSLTGTGNVAVGGNQTQGGFNLATDFNINPASFGGYLRGGRGWRTGSRSAANPLAVIGGGGGGGFYGGGGGHSNAAGGGGSSTYNPKTALERLNRTSFGAVNPADGQRSIAPATTDPAYPGSPIAQGGSATFSATPTGNDGGNGFVQIFTYADLPQPVRVSQQDAQIVSVPLGAVRVSQQTAEVLTKFENAPVRVSQQTAEIAWSMTDPQPVRVSQQTVEIIYSL